MAEKSKRFHLDSTLLNKMTIGNFKKSNPFSKKNKNSINKLLKIK